MEALLTSQCAPIMNLILDYLPLSENWPLMGQFLSNLPCHASALRENQGSVTKTCFFSCSNRRRQLLLHCF